MATATVVAIRRYPVKSLLGEDLDACSLTAGGLVGDRAFALADVDSGTIASAKRPARWRQLLSLRATTYRGAVVVTFPDGRDVILGAREADQVLSSFLGRSVTVRSAR